MNPHQFNRCMFTSPVGIAPHIHLVIDENSRFNTRFLNPKYTPRPFETPFSNVFFALPNEYMDSGHWLMKPQPAFEGTYEEYILALKNALKDYFRKHIDPNQKYLFSHSSGSDSRFISGTMAEMCNDGEMDFANVHFRCHAPENSVFIQIMKRQGWPESQYSIFDPGEDCYGIGVDNICVNGWQGYSNQMNYWSDIVTDPKEWVIITGEGGELFKYMAKTNAMPTEYTPNYHLNMLIEHNPGNGEWDNQNAAIFKDAIMPLWSYEYLAVSNRVRREFIQDLPSTGWDNIRTDLVESVGMNGFPFVANDYMVTWKIPKERQGRMTELFYSGRFYKEFEKHIPKGIDFFTNPFGWESKVWGFAVTVYDKIK